MCYNCGCKKPNDTHNKSENIVNEIIKKSAEAMNISFADAINNMRELTDIEIKEHARGLIHGHDIEHYHDHDHSTN